MKKPAIAMLATTVIMSTSLTPVEAATYHTVKSGDTLYSISKQYNVSVNNIMSWNKLSSSMISAGQKLQVSAGNATVYTVKSGDTLFKIASSYGVTAQNILDWNSLKSSTIFVGQKLTIYPGNSAGNSSNSNSSNSNASKPSTSTSTTTTTTSTYVVKSGDTLFSISRSQNVSMADIKSWNNLKTDNISVGQKLVIKKTTSSNSVPNNSTSNSGSSTVVSTNYAKITASSLNLREMPNGKIMMEIPNGAKVQVLGTSGTWTQVVYQSKTGWVASQYLETIKEEVEKFAKVTASSLNLRKDPNGVIITQIPNNVTVKIIGTSGTWTQVVYGSYTGWVASEYLQIQNQSGSGSNRDGKVVLLDPGHGGSDAGAVNGSVYEKVLAMTFANKTKTYLENLGYQVHLTREGDKSCLSVYTSASADLKCRVEMIDTKKADILVSIHMNSVGIAGVIGTETYYGSNSGQPSESKALATAIHKQYQPAMGSSDRGVKDGNLYVLRNSSVPAALLEIGFMSDMRDLDKLTNSTYQNNISSAVAKGIDNYFKAK